MQDLKESHTVGVVSERQDVIDDQDPIAAAEEWIAKHHSANDDNHYHDTDIVELPSAKAGVHIQTTPAE